VSFFSLQCLLTPEIRRKSSPPLARILFLQVVPAVFPPPSFFGRYHPFPLGESFLAAYFKIGLPVRISPHVSCRKKCSGPEGASKHPKPASLRLSCSKVSFFFLKLVVERVPFHPFINVFPIGFKMSWSFILFFFLRLEHPT